MLICYVRFHFVRSQNVRFHSFALFIHFFVKKFTLFKSLWCLNIRVIQVWNLPLTFHGRRIVSLFVYTPPASLIACERRLVLKRWVPQRRLKIFSSGHNFRDCLKYFLFSVLKLIFHCIWCKKSVILMEKLLYLMWCWWVRVCCRAMLGFNINLLFFNHIFLF